MRQIQASASQYPTPDDYYDALNAGAIKKKSFTLNPNPKPQYPTLDEYYDALNAGALKKEP